MCDIDVDVSSLDDDALRDQVLALSTRADQVEAARLAALAEWDRRAVWAVDGAVSGASWLAARGNVTRGAASSAIRSGRRLAAMPVAGPAVFAGTLCPAKGRLLVGVINPRTEEAFTRDEQMLVEQIRELPVDDAAQFLRRWAMLADADGPRPDDDHDHDTAHCSQTLNGRVQVDANLDTECGAIFSNVLNGIVDEYIRASRDTGVALLSPARLRAMALVEMAQRASGAKPGSSQRPLIWVVAPQAAMATGTGIAEISGFGPIRSVDACRLACDATVSLVLTDEAGRIVDVGRAQRTATAAQRRLLAVRDGGCTFPGCGRPPEWCEAHHIVFWDDGGPTDLENLTLQCKAHHHLCHRGGFNLARVDGRLVFTRPDGTEIIAPAIAA